MKKYSTPTNAEMRGQGVHSIFESINYFDMADKIEAVLRQHGYRSADDILPDAWYPIRLPFDVYRAVEEDQNSTANLVSIGMKAMDTSPFPPEIDSISKALHALNQYYDIYLRNTSEAEKYTIEQISDTHIRLTDNNPYPHDLVYGFLYSVARRFRPKGTNFSLHRTYLNEENPNEAGAIYDITW